MATDIGINNIPADTITLADPIRLFVSLAPAPSSTTTPDEAIALTVASVPRLPTASSTTTPAEVINIRFNVWDAIAVESVTPAEVPFIRFSGQPIRNVFEVTTPAEAVTLAFSTWNLKVADTTTPTEAVIGFPYFQQPGTRTSVSLSIRM